MPRVAHIFALAGVLIVSTGVCRPESIPPRGADDSHEKTLVIFLVSDSALAPEASVELKKEVSSLLQPAAIRIDWRDPALDRSSLVNDYSAVIHLRGSCRPPGLSTRVERDVTGTFTLASSAVSDGIILPFGDIDCAALNYFVGPALWKEPDRVREFIYARAVARLIAHELYHVIGQTHAHAHAGVAEPAFTVAELLSDRFVFTEGTLTELHASFDAEEYSAQAGLDDVSGK